MGKIEKNYKSALDEYINKVYFPQKASVFRSTPGSLQSANKYKSMTVIYMPKNIRRREVPTEAWSKSNCGKSAT